MNGTVKENRDSRIWSLIKLGDGYGFMNTILFTFYVFDIFQAKRFKTTYQWNGMHLTEAEDTKKRWQEYTDELYKKDLNDADNHDGVITDL